MTMSNVSTVQKVVPDFLKSAQPSALTKSLVGSSGGSKRISIRGNVFRMMVGGEEMRKSKDRSMQIIIVNGAPKVSRQFYSGAYSADNITSPDCWSADGVKPDAQVTNPPHHKCDECPQNIKGSGSGGGRACRFLRRLAVQIVGDITNDVYQLVLPSQSIFGTGDSESMPFEQYIKFLDANGQSIDTMITEMSFDTDSATPKLFFKAVDYVTQEQYTAAVKASTSDAAMRAITFTAAQTDGVKKKANALTAQEPVEPKKRPSTKAETPTAKKDLSSVIDEWAQ